jgi:hypothetical protein
MTIIPEEAEIVRWIFESYLDGMTPYLIAVELNKRSLPTALGKLWERQSVLRVLDSHHVAGLRVFRGSEIGPGTWPAIIGAGMWREVQERRSYRSAVAKNAKGDEWFYLLRGLVWCRKCGKRMQGKRISGRRTYVCFNGQNKDKTQRCYRTVGQATLDAFVKDAAIDVLEHLDVTGSESAAVLSDADNEAIDADRAEIAELTEMWDNQELTTREYRRMRKVVDDRINRIQAKTVVRPAVEVLEGLVGPDARKNWDAFEKAGNWERLNAVLRFLIAAVRISGAPVTGGSFDYGRIDIEPNEI